MRFCPFCSAENADELAVCQACGRRLPPLPPRRGTTRAAPPTGVSFPPRQPAAPPAPRRTGNTAPPPIASSGPGSGSLPPSGQHSAVPPSPGSGALPPSGAQPPQPPTGRHPVPPGSQPGVSANVVQRQGPTTVPPGSQPGVAPNVVTGRQPAMPPAQPPTGRQPAMPPAQPPTGPAMPRESAPALPPPPARASTEDSINELMNALSPAPAAERRPPPPPENNPNVVADRRGRPDSKAPPLSPTAFTRPGSSSQPPPMQPPMRAHTPSQPPPMRAHTPSKPPPMPPPRAPGVGADDDFATNMNAPTVDITSSRAQTGIEPPPTRIQRGDLLADRPFTPKTVHPVPEIPEPGLVNSAKYAYFFARARWQRRGAIKQLGVEIKQDTEALDQVLGALGRAARGARVEGRVFSAENAAINAAEERVAQFQKEHGEVEGRKAEENSKFVDVERERNEKLVEAERHLEEAQRELAQLEGQRRALRDNRKDLERRQRAYLKAAEDHDRRAGAAPMGDARQELRRAAEGHRKEAAALEPDRQELDRKLGSLERPINEATARLDAAKAELDAAKRSLNDAREGHTHRLAELDAEQKRKAREIALADAEIGRRLVTLGTLVNLNRVEDPTFSELYQRIDRLRSAITARTTEIEKLTAEREAYDRGSLLRGIVTIGGAVIVLIALIVILLAII